MARSDLDLETPWPPLVRKSSMFMQAKNAVGLNTPGAARSAADLEAQDPVKSMPKNHVFDIVFFRHPGFILEGFLDS